ncbi:MAG: selenide, water dikinase SelD [Paracoccaceae bacterium]
MNNALPLTRELVLVGGGHTHALVLRMWGMKPLPGVSVTVINPEPTAPYTGMLPGYIAGHYNREALDIDLVRLARFANVRLIEGRVGEIDTQQRVVVLDSGRRIPYDVASVDIGITSDLPALEGFREFGTAAKPLGRYADAWQEFRDAVKAGNVSADIAVIGGGVGGAELSLAMRHALISDGSSQPNITLLEADKILNRLENKAIFALRNELLSADILVMEGVEISSLSEGQILLKDGTKIASNFSVGAAGARPQEWLKDTGLHLTEGFITVEKTLQSTSFPEIFAVGDCAHLLHAPRPKAGVFAVREAPILYQNLKAILSGGKLAEFHPQKDYLKLISLGRKSALADKWGRQFSGAYLWKLKNNIDQKFMQQFRDLKPMAVNPPPEPHALGMDQSLVNKALCGGCGAKVGGTVLAEILAELPETNRADVLSQPGDDAAVLTGPDGKKQVITTDHLRAFTNDAGLMARIAAVHALGDILAMGAQAQVALSTLILPRMSLFLQKNMLHDIMTNAAEIFALAGAEIVGGHTSMGAELTIGFTVTGLCAEPITLGGARVGDVLVLTKPIGSGTVLAGEMTMLARGEWVSKALKIMSVLQINAAHVLTVAHAMTDVTGFGLAGHLKGMAMASGVGIEIDLDAVDFMDGATELSKMGVKSTIYPDNRALVPEVDPGNDPRADLLFDPQTAGGLVAAISAERISDIMSELKVLGCNAKVIGRCVAGGGEVSVV